MLNEDTKQAKLAALAEAKQLMTSLMAKSLKGGNDEDTNSPASQDMEPADEASSPGNASPGNGEVELSVDGNVDPEMLKKLEELYSKLS